MSEPFVLDGEGRLSIGDIVRLARDPSTEVRRATTGPGLDRLDRTVALIADAVEQGQAHVDDPDPEERRRHLVYGVTTGLGHNKNRPLASPEAAKQLQKNLIISHAAGIGINTDPDDLNNYFAPEIVRALLMIRAAMFLQGYSGVRRELVDQQLGLLNAGVVPLIPKKGSVGSSGDLAPLSHLAQVLIGEGRALFEGEIVDGATALKRAGLKPYEPTYKEGLALTNGTTVALATALFALHDAARLIRAADSLVAMSLEAMLGPTRAFEPFVHRLRPHPGQIRSATNVRNAFQGSRLVNQSGEVQSLYSLRCAPQVHGAAHETWRHAAEVLTRELNAVTDNPLFDPDLKVEDTLDGGSICRFNAFSAGNFHGEPVGFVMDFLAVAMSEIANLSERRIQMLLDRHTNGDLPQDLITDNGLNSGFMILQYSAAALVSENKVLSHPASVDSIPTSSNAEDHVAMSPHASRKAGEILGNAFSVLGIELLAATQALCYRTGRLAFPKDAPGKTFEDEDLGAGTRAAFTRALDVFGHDGEPFTGIVRDDRAPAPLAREARAALESDFADQVSAACAGVAMLGLRSE